MAPLPSPTAPLRALLSATMQLPAGQCCLLSDCRQAAARLPSGAARTRPLAARGRSRRGKTSQGWFCGFKLHVLRPLEGRIVNLVLTPGNWDDRAPVLTLLDGVDGGVTLGDLGDRGQQRAAKWAEEAEMLVLTRADAPEQKFLLAQGRQAIETSFSQLWYQFLDRVFSRSWRGLWNTIQFKVLHYNLRHAGVLSL
jgi:transposase